MNKSFRLIVHQKNFSGEDLIINPKDYPEAKLGDILEIYHSPPEDDGNKIKRSDSEEEYPRLLLQIKAFQDDSVQQNALQKDTISVEQSIAQAFGLQTYKNVLIRIVDPIDIALDSIELTFKDQYMGRSEMWRLKNSLINTCVYMKKNIEFCSGAVRCQVYEMWSQGDRVACGVITDDTKVVFRSSTSMVYLFLQMSSEMWDFDIYGDLYFEKAVNGFLADLFMKWKKNLSNHEVTIVLFSRTFYEANYLEEFPLHMRECLQKDYKGRYYEDFYRVAIQNERYDDWSGILVQLRRIFSEYLKIVLEYHKRDDLIIPAATNSTAAQGNFLEVLNMSLNVFEKHYLDRSFDRTGQLSVVVTPGVGVFEVDRELTNITKQRIIDNGVGSDLVCVGEQPLHAVPLLKFHNKDTHLNVPDDYSMPHWINLSFYSTNKKIAYSNFIPRIKLPPPLPNNSNTTKKVESPKKLVNEDDYIHNSFFDYDAYDAQVFQIPPVYTTVHESVLIHQRLPSRYKRNSDNLIDSQDKGQRRKMSDPDILHRNDSNTRSEPIAIPSTACSPTMTSPHNEEKELSPPVRMVVGSEGSPSIESRALINPFDPSHVTIKLTSNRRRWTHIFPKGPTGVLIQQHHYQARPTQIGGGLTPNTNGTNDINSERNVFDNNQPSFCVTAALHEYCKKRPNSYNSSHHNISLPQKNPSKSLTLLWGATGEQEWTPALTTGVDWKSLTIPACLPITTDYFPDKRALQMDYVLSLYTLLPDSVNADFAQQRQQQQQQSTSSTVTINNKKLLSTYEVFKELISQRLAQGFQLVLMENNNNFDYDTNKNENEINEESYCLSIGRLFHKITLAKNTRTIYVTRYRPRHPYPGFNYQYRYRFHAPHHDTYEESYASFTTEKLEHFNWNYLDHYVTTGGDTEFTLVDALKYWRFRVYLLPLNNPATKMIIDGSERCDIYQLPNQNDYQLMIDGLLKFLETAINKIKRCITSKKARMSLSVINNAPLVQPRRNSMSNFSQNSTAARLNERLIATTTLRSGSKVMDRNRSLGTADSIESHDGSNPGDNSVQLIPLLKSTATNLEIIDSMKNPINGLLFINCHNNLPSTTFIAADAINWLITHMENIQTIEQSFKKFQLLYKDGLIRHASGDTKKPFIYGFYLYYIIDNNNENNLYEPNGDLQNFENEWLEVEIKSPLNWGMRLLPPSSPTMTSSIPNSTNISLLPISNCFNDSNECGVPHFLCDKIDADYAEYDLDGGLLYKRIRLETDLSNKSDRTEWGHVKYQTIFRPDQAYEFVVEWLTSSGSIVAELLSSWHRKAQTSGLQMIPIPHDPLALPYSNKSDPLRGPIFIPLNIQCLIEHDRLFKEFKEDTVLDRLFLFQEAIIQRFGFIQCLLEPLQPIHNAITAKNNSASREHQYIHSTGTVFILISNTTTVKSTTRNRLTTVNSNSGSGAGGSGCVGSASNRLISGRYSVHADVVPSPHEAYITRHVSGKNKDDYDNSRKTGFLWSWNHMVSRRWRTNQGVDNNFQTKLLKDFREFCANYNDRLRIFWEESWEIKENSTTSPRNINLVNDLISVM